MSGNSWQCLATLARNGVCHYQIARHEDRALHEDKAMYVRRTGRVLIALVVFHAGCARQPPARAPMAPAGGWPVAMQLGELANGESDPEQVRAADISILFVGNSHTMMHDLPNLVCKMMQFQSPHKKIYAHYIPVAYLEDVERNTKFSNEIESRAWKRVVLQAQKISASGKFDYSRKEGIEFAKLAKAHGAAVCFFAEWGLKDVEGNGPRTEKIYREMARAADVDVAPIGRAWDLALAQRPELPLHAGDGNHQSALGAFLTACVLVGRLTGESPAQLASFPYLDTDPMDRKLLADAAAKAIAERSE